MSQKKNSSPIIKAYAISTATFFGLSWIASALVSNPDPAEGNSEFAMIMALVLGGLCCWSPSIGLFMFKKWWYGVLSGLGRLVIIGACVFADRRMLADLPEGQGHAYLTFLGILAAFTWGMIDFVIIYFVGKKSIEQQLKNN